MKLATCFRTLSGCALGAAFLLGASSASTQAAILASWTFETSVPTTAGPHAAESGSGAATAVQASSAAVYSNPAGNGSAESFSSNNWAVADYYQFTATSPSGPMVCPKLVFTWDQTSSNTGPRDFEVQFSADGGAYSSLGTVAVLANASPNPVWNTTTASPLYTSMKMLTNVTATTFSFRVINTSTVSANGGTVATTGTTRVDNVTIESVVPEPCSGQLAGILGVVAAMRSRRWFVA
jgi:hypothetical protein